MNGEEEVVLVEGDAVDWFDTLPNASVDLVITDPPYESLEKHRARGTTTRRKKSKSSSSPWFPVFPNSRFPELFSQLHRVMKKNVQLYVFTDSETMFVMKPIAEAASFKVWKPLIWDKKKIGMGYHYRARYEFVLFFEKGKRALQDLSIPDIIEADRIWRGYPTETRVAVSEVLIRQSSKPGDTVCDPFMGSGSVGVAATKSGRRFWGCDVQTEAVELARTKLIPGRIDRCS